MIRRKMLLLLAACAALSGCSAGSAIENVKTGAAAPQASQDAGVPDVDIDALFEAALPGPLLPPDQIPGEPICTDFANLGLLRVCYTDESGEMLKLQVLMGENSVVYNLKGDGSLEDFSLQYGDGEYTARIMQNIRDNQYFAVESKTFSVAIDEPGRVYLHSIQNVDWDYEKAAIAAVRRIVSDSLVSGPQDLHFSCTRDLYDYITGNIVYDGDKMFGLYYDYLPDIDQTYLDGKGICYDYASLFAAMLRSISIPAKLVKGYASAEPDVYHAWNEVFVGGQWHVIDTTKDAGAWRPRMQKNSADYLKVYEY